jgi:hypothetical protein
LRPTSSCLGRASKNTFVFSPRAEHCLVYGQDIRNNDYYDGADNYYNESDYDDFDDYDDYNDYIDDDDDDIIYILLKINFWWS